ncbi:MAG TPA: exodeoxyribonuclease VII small subunit [Candidatus Omnitrophica bacterium]|nr:exodeoxyribonuclease VII small subunit [Candidatus Omnitrophota bacterium]HCI44632.1 exodeoxyribonuclease VII small subunit [Candidatus Omnitrophota bacterium]
MAETKYNKAIKRLEEIIEKIENEEIDVDELSEKVKEAVELITTCKERIEKAEMEVKRVVDDLGEEGEKK